jgi:hypothetical protein
MGLLEQILDREAAGGEALRVLSFQELVAELADLLTLS